MLLTGLSRLGAGGEPRLALAVRSGGLALLAWGLWSEVRPGPSGAHLAVWILVATIAPAWLLAGALAGRVPHIQLAALGWMGLAGGAVAAMAPIGLVFVATAALTAAIHVELRPALGAAALGPAGLAIAQLVDKGKVTGLLAGALAVASAGLVVGLSRRQSLENARREALVAVERERADLLAERNRLAREVHDVLAHTLGALTVQLEALDARLTGDGEAPAFVYEGVASARSLAAEGLAEARRAVRALRDDAEPLAAQVRRLCHLRGAELVVEGQEREMSPEATLAMFRVVQEALTNAAKHAPGAPLRVTLSFEADAVQVEVGNGPAAAEPGALAGTGSGYGLDGIRERMRLVGGRLEAGPDGRGWLVEARLPL